MVTAPPLTNFLWNPSWLLAPSRFPPVGLFDRVTHCSELAEVLAIESLTNACLRDTTGEPQLAPRNQKLPGSSPNVIIASFANSGQDGSRFSNGNYGLYYAAKNLETALAEARFHRTRFLQRTNEPAINIGMRSYASVISTELHDIRGMRAKLPAVYDENSYAESQRLALELRNAGSNGLLFDSVRHTGGECVGIFKPTIPQPVVQGSYYCFQWDGKSIFNIFQKSTC